MRKLFIGLSLWLVALGVQAGSFLGDADAIARQLVAVAQTTANTAVSNAATADGKAVAAQTTANLKANTASPALTGTPTAPTASAGTNTTQIATTAFATTALNLKANLASPALTGTPTAPTAAVGTNTTQIATTAYAAAAAGAYGAAPTWHDVAGSRAFGSTYTNPTAHVMFVAITGSNGSVPVFSTGGIAVCSMDAARSQCNFPVAAGASYTSSVAGGTVSQWAEFY